MSNQKSMQQKATRSWNLAVDVFLHKMIPAYKTDTIASRLKPKTWQAVYNRKISDNTCMCVCNMKNVLRDIRYPFIVSVCTLPVGEVTRS